MEDIISLAKRSVKVQTDQFVSNASSFHLSSKKSIVKFIVPELLRES